MGSAENACSIVQLLRDAGISLGHASLVYWYFMLLQAQLMRTRSKRTITVLAKPGEAKRMLDRKDQETGNQETGNVVVRSGEVVKTVQWIVMITSIMKIVGVPCLVCDGVQSLYARLSRSFLRPRLLRSPHSPVF